MFHLSTIRQHFDSGFHSVVSLIDELERQIEALTLADQSPNHFQGLELTIKSQQKEIQRVNQTIENKSNQMLSVNRQNHQLRKQFQARLAQEQQINQQLQQQLQLKISPAQPLITDLQNQIEKLQFRLAKASQVQLKFETRVSEANQLNLQLKARIRELEKALESDKLSTIKLDSHNSSLPPSSDLPWIKPKLRWFNKSGMKTVFAKMTVDDAKI